MRAGSLDSVIFIQSPVTVIDEFGTPTESWQVVAKMRAAVLQYSVDDREGRKGCTTETSVTFLMRHLKGIGLDQRLIYKGNVYCIRDIQELGRGRGLAIGAERKFAC